MLKSDLCLRSGACLSCENSRVRSLLRGRVPARCKAQFFMKRLPNMPVTALISTTGINRNLIQPSSRCNLNVKTSLAWNRKHVLNHHG